MAPNEDENEDVALTARQRARQEVTAEIVDAARRQLADVGAAALSLRAVAREVGMVSSGIYRYVESRDDLLTRLIIEAYDSLGDAVDAAITAAGDEVHARRWVAGAEAVRDWAVARPHEWALLYGSPVPGYAAPEDTVVPGTRVSLALVAIVRDAADHGVLAPPEGAPSTAAPFTDALDLDVAPAVEVRLVAAWTQLFGLVSFEVFGQTTGLIEDHAGAFRATSETMAAWLGLPS